MWTTKLNTRLIITVFALGMCSTAFAGQIIYVEPDITRSKNASPADFQFDIQYPSIQAAIDAAADGDTIILAPGTFRGDGNRDIDFKGKAVTLRSTNPNEPNIVAATIIDCNGSEQEPHRGFYFHSEEDANSIIAGLTVINGVAWKGGAVLCSHSSPRFTDCVFRGNQAYDDDTGGGAMYNEDCSPTLIDCLFTDNEAMPSASYGGGIANNRSSPTLANCTFINNRAWSGGGIYNTENSSPKVTECIFTDNAAYRGGGMTCEGNNATISQCTFSGNSADWGGGIYNAWSSPTLTNCTFSRNTAGDFGGGMCNEYSSPTVIDCTFSYNTSGDKGGGMNNRYDSSPTVINCIFSCNTTYESGGGMANYRSSPRIVNSTFSGNYADTDGGGMYNHNSNPTLTNCIIWGNLAGEARDQIWGGAVINYSCIQGGWSGQGNIGADPYFADPQNGDYHLLSGSGCIDTGNNTVVTVTTDLDGNARIVNGTVDMGAYEYQGARTIYVDADATGANNGSSWAKAYKYLQDALMFASAEDEIRVGQGVYRPDEFVLSDRANLGRMETFQLINGVTIKGGYAGLGEADPDARDIEKNETILSGDLDGNDIDVNDPYDLFDEPSRAENSYHVVTGSNTDANAVLDGFTIAAGNANNGDLYSPHQLGGGMYNYESSPTVIACTFARNSAVAGGGMYNMDSSPTLRNCSFIANSAHKVLYYGGTGGGMYTSFDSRASHVEVANCLFEGNSAVSGGGIMSHGQPVITDSIFRKNSGGGMWLATAKLTGCTFTLNRGGGLFISGDTHLSNCLFTGNIGCGLQAQDCDIVAINCSFIGNITSAFFAGIWNDEGDTTVTNCISWGNIGKDGVTESAQIATHDPAVINYCCIQGWTGALGGTGNTGADPLFVSEGRWDAFPDFNDDYWERDVHWLEGDYHLKSQSGRWEPNSQSWVNDDGTSLCIDAGDPGSPIGYEPFPNGGIINMGAYGGTSEAGKSYFGEPICETIVAGDINGDCIVDLCDLALISYHWLEDKN